MSVCICDDISVRHLTPLNEKEGKENMHPWLIAR